MQLFHKCSSLKVSLALVCLAFFASEFSFAKKTGHSKPKAPNLADHARHFSDVDTKANQVSQMKADKLRLESIRSIKSFLKRKMDPSREFELFLRLAELYTERSDYIRGLEIDVWGKAHDKWSQAKKGAEPKLTHSRSKRELGKAELIYKQMLKRFPSEGRLDAVYFSLARVTGLLNKKGMDNYLYSMIKKYPRSRLVPDAWLVLGEYYFDSHNIPKAITSYRRVMQFKDSPAYPYAVYKLGWAFFNATPSSDEVYVKNIRKSVAAFKLVVTLATEKNDKRANNLRENAIRELAMVWAEIGEVGDAEKYFTEIDEPEAFFKTLKRMAGIFSSQGKNKAALDTYDRLIRDYPDRIEARKFIVATIDILDALKQPSKVKERLDYGHSFSRIQGKWYQSHLKLHREELDEIQSQLKKKFHRYGTLYHKNGIKIDNKIMKEAALGIYTSFVGAFPQAPETDEIRFYRAELLYHMKRYLQSSESYGFLVRDPRSGKYHHDAALASISALNKQVEIEKFAKIPKWDSFENPIEIPKTKALLVKAIDRYLKFYPGRDSKKTLLLGAAKIEYAHGHHKKALIRYEKAGRDIPHTNEGRDSIRTVLRYYAKRELLEDLETNVRSFRKLKGVKGKFKKELNELLVNTVFQRGVQLSESGNHHKASKQFEAFASEFPRNSKASQALSNAALGYYKIGEIEKGMNADHQLIEKYPKSKLVPGTLINLGNTYQSLARFDKAADVFTEFHRRYPNRKEAEEALLKGSILYVGLKKTALGEKYLKKYLNKYPQSTDWLYANKTLIELYERSNNYSSLKNRLEAHLRRASSADEKYEIESELVRLEYNLGNKVSALSKAKLLGKRLSKDKSRAAFASRRIISSILFDNLESTYTRFDKNKIKSAQTIEKDVNTLQGYLVKLAKEYQVIIDIGSGEFLVASLYRLGQLHEKFAEKLYKAPDPIGASEQVKRTYRDSIAKVADPLKAESFNYFQTAYERSVEVQVFSEWTKIAYKKMIEIAPDRNKDVDVMTTDSLYQSLPLSKQGKSDGYTWR